MTCAIPACPRCAEWRQKTVYADGRVSERDLCTAHDKSRGAFLRAQIGRLVRSCVSRRLPRPDPIHAFTDSMEAACA